MRYIAILFFLFLSTGVFAQNEALANNYFEEGEYEKALRIYNKLYKKTPQVLKYLQAIVACNQQLEHYKKAETVLINRLNSSNNYPQLLVELGYNFELQDSITLAEKQYQKALDVIEVNPTKALIIGNTFDGYSLLDWAVSAYERGMELNQNANYNIQLARIYGEQGHLEKMFSKYITLIEKRESYRRVAIYNFNMFITENPDNEANILLRKALLKKIQTKPDILYNQLLSWLFIQQKDFKKAFIQEKAIFKRSEEFSLNGIIDLALIAMDEKAYDNAIEILDYLIDVADVDITKLDAMKYKMEIAVKTTSKKNYDDIIKLFEAIFEEYGKGINTYILQINYNHFLAFSYGQKEEAIKNLKSLSKKKLTRFQAARVKMELADILVFDEKFNEALIYYSQIQKKVQNNTLAQEARFKVAQTSYFKGDFSWAQVQLDVLKKSASQLIANDAMQLSLLISDNSVEDSTQTALKKYARADLLALQFKFEEAISILTGILKDHKGESLEDEALLKQASLFEKTLQYKKAEANYLNIIEFYKEDILADDAYFKLAELYYSILQETEKAKEYYEQIVFNFADSIYFVEARKKYRMLRGDDIE